MNYVFHPEAMLELERAVDYYVEQGGQTLANAFLREIYRIVEMVANNPGFGAHIGEQQQRRYVAKRFPYSVTYRPIPEGI
jgi:plasmid stabilization system protein ParE